MKKYIKKIFVVICTILGCSSFNVFSQQTPQYTNYILNYHALNPAASGTYGCADFKVGYRTQWVGFEGAPKTQFAQGNYFIKRKRKLWKRSRQAFGLLFENDRTANAPIGQLRFQVSYAYHVPIHNNGFFSAGLFAGINQYVFQNSNLQPKTLDDPLLTGSGAKLLYPDLNPGIMYYNEKGFIGLSVKNAYGNKLSGVVGQNSKLARHFYLTAGYTIGGEKALFRYTPSINIKMVTMNLPSVDANFMVTFDNKIDFGGAYRLVDGVSGFVNYRLKKWSIAYSYDFNLSKIRYASSNSHEIILSYRICPKDQSDYTKDESCPAYR